MDNVRNSVKKEEDKELRLHIRRLAKTRNIEQGRMTYSGFLSDKLLLAESAKKGVPIRLFKEIKSNSPFDDKQWSGFLDINIRTLQRYRKDDDHVFRPIQSEKILELAEVVSLGNELFDTPEKFSLWLNTPSIALGDNKPIDLLDTSFGKDMVISELSRIEHGVFV